MARIVPSGPARAPVHAHGLEDRDAQRDVNRTSPTRNTDGTRLTNLDAYRVFYGQTSRNYTKSVYVPAAATHSVVIEGLASGTWYFAIKSINTLDIASAYSGEVRVTL